MMKTGVTMAGRRPLCIVIRIPSATLSRDELEAALRGRLSRYESSGDGTSAYAQIDIADEPDAWAAAIGCVQSVRDTLRHLNACGRIGSPVLDIAVAFPSSLAATSLKIPAGLAAAAGQAGIGIEVSIYCTSDE
ncbi:MULTISPECIES: hypothetical protein [unclassified Bradyrhizobium]|uniref:hypothetical protein n=1 Tax=unclassified Bradyrhizobium TaxID=2631580 RepID=UPI0028EF817F|nr:MULTISPECIES: hypothetical protein [unclassified Bradyrhizobium]